MFVKQVFNSLRFVCLLSHYALKHNATQALVSIKIRQLDNRNAGEL